MDSYFQNQAGQALTASYVLTKLPFHAKVFILSNDDIAGLNLVFVSFNGVNDHVILKPGESITLDYYNLNVVSFFLKYGVAAPQYRVMAFGE